MTWFIEFDGVTLGVKATIGSRVEARALVNAVAVYHDLLPSDSDGSAERHDPEEGRGPKDDSAGRKASPENNHDHPNIT